MFKIIGTEQLSSCDWGRLNKKVVLNAIKYAINKDNWKHIDTAAVYDLGKVEKIIGLNPKIFNNSHILSKVGFRWKKKKNKRAHTYININEKDIQSQAEESLMRLKKKKIHTFFLHRIDRTQSLEKQIEFNKKHNITPKSIIRKNLESLSQKSEAKEEENWEVNEGMSKKELTKMISALENEMIESVRKLKFEKAALLRDQISFLKEGSSPMARSRKNQAIVKGKQRKPKKYGYKTS